MSNKIKAARVHQYSGLDENGKPLATPGPLRDVISMDEIDAPECGDGQTLISANYAGVQYPDALQAQGLYQERPELPYVPGLDLTGTVLEIGSAQLLAGLQRARFRARVRTLRDLARRGTSIAVEPCEARVGEPGPP